jgi:hypothetical protein
VQDRPALQLGVGSFAGPALAGVGGVDLLLVARQAAVAAAVGIEPAPTLWNPDPRPATLVGGVGERVDPGGVERVDQTVLARGADVVAGTGQGR